jgi:NAD(P)-dependent dehydrogenase (short-subunit alcohol dehydrogenase family)
MKSILITGTSRGLGHALVKRYLEDGYRVFGCGRSADSPSMRELKEKWGDKYYPVAMDVTKIEEVKSMAEFVAGHGSLDIIISNATSSSKEGNKGILAGCDTENMLNGYNVNAVGLLRIVKCCLPNLAPNATIAAITSESGSMMWVREKRQYDYGAAKAALNFNCVVLQRELSPLGYRVLSIHPGWLKNSPDQPVWQHTKDEAAAIIAKTIASPPPFDPEGNKGVLMWNDGRDIGTDGKPFGF